MSEREAYPLGPQPLAVLLAERCDIIEDAVQTVRARMAAIRSYIDKPDQTWPEELKGPWPEPFHFAWQASHTRGITHEISWASLEFLELPLGLRGNDSELPESLRGTERACIWWQAVRDELSRQLALTGPDAGVVRSEEEWLDRFDMAYGESMVAERHMSRLHGYKARLQSLVSIAVPVHFQEPARGAIQRAVRLYLLGLDVECIGFARVALEAMVKHRGGARIGVNPRTYESQQTLETLIDLCLSPTVLTGLSTRQVGELRRMADGLRVRGNDVLHANLRSTGTEQARDALLALSRIAIAFYPPPAPTFYEPLSDEEFDRLIDDMISLGRSPESFDDE